MIHSHSASVARLETCAASSTVEFFKVLAFRDPSQREVLVGNAFRTGFNDPLTRKRMQRWSQLPFVWKIASGIWYIKEWLDTNVLMAKERRLQQLLYCLDEKVEAYQKEGTFTTGLSFFMTFWAILTLLQALALFVLFIEYLRSGCRRKTPRKIVVEGQKKIESLCPRPLSRPCPRPHSRARTV